MLVFIFLLFCNVSGHKDNVFKETSINSCATKILIGFDSSNGLNQDTYLSERRFIVDVLLSNWLDYERLAMLSFSNDTVYKKFASFSDNVDLASFVYHDSINMTDVKPSICNVFKVLSGTKNLEGAHVILFLSMFDSHVDFTCLIPIAQLKKTVDSISFVGLTEHININDVTKYFPGALYLEWDMVDDEYEPENWIPWFKKAIGCTRETYFPCNNHIIFAMDVSKIINIDRFTYYSKFISESVLGQWTHFESLSLMMYTFEWAYTKAYKELNSYDDTDNDASLCNAFTEALTKTLLDAPAHMIIFVYMIDQIEDTCDDTYRAVQQLKTQITFVSLSPNGDSAYIKDIFPDALVVDWDLENTDWPKNWTRNELSIYGCDKSDFTTVSKIATTLPSTFQTTHLTETSSSMGKSTSEIDNLTSTTAPTLSTMTNKKSSLKYIIYLAVFIPLVILIICLLSLCLFCWKKRQSSHHHQQQLNKLAISIIRATGLLRMPDPWLISCDKLNINYTNKLGEGGFADVYLGRLTGEAPINKICKTLPVTSNFKNCEVAVKIARNAFKEDFQRELEFMKDLGYHQNLVAMLGYASNEHSVFLVLEYCEDGSLLQYLRKQRQRILLSQEVVKIKQLVCYALQVSNGLNYLARLNLIHRDIAARNVLLTDNYKVCKISDFGISRSTNDDQTYISKRGKFPVKWLAIESLKNFQFSTKSDVWSYGVLMFEIFSLGDVPYSKLNNSDILIFLEMGNRLEKPAFCCQEIYNLMLLCWQASPKKRPNFDDICKLLTEVIESSNDEYNYIQAIKMIQLQQSELCEEEFSASV